MYSCLVSTYMNIKFCGSWLVETMAMRTKPITDLDQEYNGSDNIFFVQKMER